ncbi:MAG: hypothetical protein DMD55_07770 [Gemmatimonadetes bacterium]|nr:MAG: hypothetical protein DMD55_07770 [Gemmatimonadota bacterium]
MHGHDLGQPLGPGYAHLVVLGVLKDERALLDAFEQQRRARDARPQVRGRNDAGLAVPQQGDEAAQAAVEQDVRLDLCRELQVRGEGRVPIGPNPVPGGKVVAGFGPDGGDRLGALRGRELLGADQRERDGEAQTEDRD